MSVFQGTANTITGISAEIGSMFGIKGGGAWMQEKFALPGGGLRPAIKGFGAVASREGLPGVLSYGKHFFGFGMQGAMQKRGALLGSRPYAELMAGGRGASWGALQDLSRTMPGVHRRRRIAGAAGGAAALVGVSSTVGLGNAAMMAGAGVGMAGVARYLGKGRPTPWTGGRAGKFGAAATGLGLLTGVI